MGEKSDFVRILSTQIPGGRTCKVFIYTTKGARASNFRVWDIAEYECGAASRYGVTGLPAYSDTGYSDILATVTFRLQ